MENQPRPAASFNAVILCATAATIMAYGWGYRGIVGHEGGAMVPGALLGMAICLASGRGDWYRRTAVAGLFGAAGWAWGGSMSYMEHTMYAVSDSLPDVLYGYAVLFFMGALWAGIGGAVLGLAFTLPRSALQRLAGPFTAVGVAYLLAYLYLFFDAATSDLYHRFVAQHFHDGDFVATLLAVLVCALYALVRKRERAEALLFVWVCAGWFAGYLALTKFGGIQLAPPYRSESWGGVLGILVVLLVHLARTRNRAALLLSLYGIVGGGLAFALAVFIRHPIRVGWGPFASWGGAMQWKIAEESFGLLMGLAIALGALRLLRGRLAPAEEDVPARPLDIFSVFVVVIVLLWMNVRRAPERWIYRYEIVGHDPVAGLPPWIWFNLGGLLLTGLAVYGLRQYARGAMAAAPATPFGKGLWVLLILLWTTVAAAFTQHLPAPAGDAFPLVDMTFLALAGVSTALLLRLGNPAMAAAPPEANTAPSDLAWRPGKPIYAACAAVPVVLLAITALSMAMQDGPVEGARLRFGPDAYWREATAVVGAWEVAGASSRPAGEPESEAETELNSITFLRDRSVIVAYSTGEEVWDQHTWFHADSRIHLEWFGRTPDNPDHATLVLALAGGNLYLPWPPKGNGAGYLVLKRVP